MMAYNLHGASSTLSAAERGKEAIRLVALLDEVDRDEWERRTTAKARAFVDETRIAASLLPADGVLPVTDAQLYFLRDLWAKFA